MLFCLLSVLTFISLYSLSLSLSLCLSLSFPPSLQHCFIVKMREPLLHLFLRVLTQQSHDLLQEELVHCVYGIAEEDFIYFHMDFLSKFLGSIEGLQQDQQLRLVERYNVVQVCTRDYHVLVMWPIMC